MDFYSTAALHCRVNVFFTENKVKIDFFKFKVAQNQAVVDYLALIDKRILKSSCLFKKSVYLCTPQTSGKILKIRG